MTATSVAKSTSSLTRFVIANTVIATIAGLPISATAAALQFECNSQLNPVTVAREVRLSTIDQEQFNTAVLFYVNLERCNRGLVKLQPDERLMQATFQHSSHMATNAYISHKSRQPGYRNLQDRLAKANVSYRVAGENVVKSFVYAFNKQRVSGNRENCSFNYVSNGSLVPRHTYNTLAKNLVTLWMASPTHRSNILHQSYRRAGATFGINSAQGFCGTIYAAQNFTN